MNKQEAIEKMVTWTKKPAEGGNEKEGDGN